MKKKKWKIKKRYIFIAILLTIIITGTVFFQFTSTGYCMTIRFRGFTEAEHNIFINNTYSYITANENNELVGKNDIPAFINEAKNIVSDFFGGELQSAPVFIISDNPDTYKKTGDRHTYTFVLHNVFSYITLSHRYLNLNNLTHEIMHTELHYRVLHGKPFRGIDSFIPYWFNEGLASYNDNRAIMSEEALQSKTKIIDATKLTRADFNRKHVNDEFFNALIIQDYYLFSRHEVKSWIDKNSIDALLQLIDDVRAGKNFYDLYIN